MVKKVVKKVQVGQKTVKKATGKVKMAPNKKETVKDMYDVVIVGGGPAGIMAACTAGAEGQKVLVLEKNEALGKKLLISGGGRCNITNANPDHREFVSKFGKKGNFLFSPLSIFGVPQTIKFFNDLGLKIKVEAGFRVFPESDNSEDVLNILIRQAQKVGVEFKMSSEVSSFTPSLDKKKSIKSVILKDGTEIKANKFILATGGMSHPETGSTGDGFKWLKALGHTVAAANPSLVPIKIKETWVNELSGITLNNVGISVWTLSDSFSKKELTKKGRVLFTHVGLTGPTILNMSKNVGELLEYSKDGGDKAGMEVILALDFFPGVGLDMMHEMMLKTFETNINKKVKNLSFKEVPAKIFELILKQLEIDPEWEINEIKREERLALIEKFKKFEMKVGGLLGFDKAIISSGGLDLTEVDFKTMGSRLYSNLYLVGDILDFDRPSGGFSLQLCWTTGYIAGKGAK